ncbi:MAG: dihydrodipicolinate reductase [Silicimonas sp.]|nr:dihydrodipicolinate reductase [Silicimonas sp.]
MRFVALWTTIAALLAGPAFAEGFQRVDDRNGFLSLVKDRELKRLGVRLRVLNAGRIAGRAFGQDVTGSWDWKGGYFCRDLAVDGDPLEYNCQLVQVNGRTVRFTSDKGSGIYADLRLQ